MAGLKKIELGAMFKNKFNSFITCACRRNGLYFCVPFFHSHHQFFSFKKKFQMAKFFSLYLDQKDLIHGIAPLLMLLLPYGTCCPYQSDPVAAWLL